MLSLIEQPKDYSQMLKRVFVATLIAGLASTLALAYFSPPIQALLFSNSTKINLGPVSLPWLVAVIPLLVAVVSRIVKLHDRISDLVGIRRRFDVPYILIPLADGVGINTTDDFKSKLNADRHDLMRKVFYKYAPNANDAVINKQYVAAALDQWGWFWCCVEPTIVVILGAVVSWILISVRAATVFFLVALALVVIARIMWPACIRAAKTQVADILSDQTRKDEIHAVFSQGC